MRHINYFSLITVTATTITIPVFAKSLKEQNEQLFRKIETVNGMSADQIKKVRSAFSKSRYIGQGNPSITKHPVSTQACLDKLKKLNVKYENKDHEKICGSKYMSPLFDPTKEAADKAKVCIDKFEFPNIPCEYPVVWTRASEAADICKSVGKRICDAHEWEGACEGNLQPPDYDFSYATKMKSHAAIKKMRYSHNRRETPKAKWSYGPKYKKGICGTNGTKSAGCDGGNWQRCGSNTFPVGLFPECKSALDVYDIHGNAAEHMNLPTKKSEQANHNSESYGYTEMKGSWFIFDKYYAHKDFCRWRAPFWHGTKLTSSHSHHNYHLGFRCCKDIGRP